MTYTPSNAVNQGDLSSGLGSPEGITWDGEQLVITDDAGRELWTLQRNNNGTYTPMNATRQGTQFGISLRYARGLAWDGNYVLVVEDEPSGSDSLWRLSRNSDGTYTPTDINFAITFPGGIQSPLGTTWDGEQLVIVDFSSRSLFTLQRRSDWLAHDPDDLVNQGIFPSDLEHPTGVTWDGTHLVIIDDTNNELWTLPRNSDGTYTPTDALNLGEFPDSLSMPSGITWDGQQLVIVALSGGDELWTLARDPDNISPVADAGPNQTVNTGMTVNLDGSSSSDIDGSIVSYSWTQTAGTTVTLTGASTSTPSFSATSFATTLVFRLTVTDNDGATDTDTVSIIIVIGVSSRFRLKVNGIWVAVSPRLKVSGTWRTVSVYLKVNGTWERVEF